MQSTRLTARKSQKKIERAYSPVSRLTRSFAFRAFVANTYRRVPIDAPHTARTERGTGDVQYVAIALPRSSTPPDPPPLRGREVSPVLEETRHRRAPERVHEPAEHRLERPPIRPAVLHPVEDPLLALPTHRDEVLGDEAVQGRRHARVRDVPRPADFPMDRPRGRLAEGPDRAEDGQFELAKFHGIREGK